MTEQCYSCVMQQAVTAWWTKWIKNVVTSCCYGTVCSSLFQRLGGIITNDVVRASYCSLMFTTLLCHGNYWCCDDLRYFYTCNSAMRRGGQKRQENDKKTHSHHAVKNSSISTTYVNWNRWLTVHFFQELSTVNNQFCVISTFSLIRRKNISKLSVNETWMSIVIIF